MMNMPPLHAKDAVAAGLIDGAKHNLSAMHNIQHLMPYPYGIIKDAAVGFERDNRLPESEPAAVLSADTQSDRSTPVEAGPSGQVPLVLAAPASDISSLQHDASQQPYILQNAAERAHLLQQCKASMSDQKKLVHVRQGYYDRKFGFSTNVADVCIFTSSKPEEASVARLHSHTGCLILDIDDYAKLIRTEAHSAAEKAANAAPTDAKPKIHPTVAVVHIEGKFWWQLPV